MATQDLQAAQEFIVNPLTPTFGAEVIGVDLSKPLSDATFAAIEQVFHKYHVVCFRDQVLDEEAHLAFTRLWGELEIFPEEDKTKSAKTFYNVANTSVEGEHLPEEDPKVLFQKVNARWHTDSSYRYIPSFASVMYSTEVLPDEAEGGETEFSNMLAAYDALSKAEKRRFEPLHMVHYYEFGRRLFPALPPITAFERDAVPPVSHPLVRVHPDRGYRRSLFFTVNAGNEISGMGLEDGQALHQWLNEYASRPEFTYSHRWRENDLVMWDNRVLLHRATRYDMAKYRRAFRRTTVAGSGPALGPFSVDVCDAPSDDESVE
ncbi:TauD/TfdA dioxygenase family protein [Halomonas organivorans]|uniref:Taurine dioxygenase/alpha-ketoglutarate-dependent 2,4-dichlorophenoxyacetate dioxygenase n=1 Tax=Halomonas organivorans TaxID=257772 RepID=A0A7W5C2L3_9GAMM|nr:TauD/TfdA family dioxygenase [Halomonas organivorans]MBB3143431.1 taurine dioxygenase/alpha-ketoglutarate-dependent 2,4-dichlorophenoxyacetate dioxygenase [Halomonas organivorans]